tara:strand:+ start:160 stop:366 length:207 start_codon:yes stop_codon:yes gene_type:complete
MAEVHIVIFETKANVTIVDSVFEHIRDAVSYAEAANLKEQEHEDGFYYVLSLPLNTGEGVIGCTNLVA